MPHTPSSRTPHPPTHPILPHTQPSYTLQESHALQSQLLTAQVERSTREATTASSQLHHVQQALHTREEQLRAVQDEVNRLEHALHTAERQLTQLNAAQRHAMQQQRALLTSPLSRASPARSGGVGMGVGGRSPLMPLPLPPPQQQQQLLQQGDVAVAVEEQQQVKGGGWGTPRTRVVPPTPDHVDSSGRTPPPPVCGKVGTGKWGGCKGEAVCVSKYLCERLTA